MLRCVQETITQRFQERRTRAAAISTLDKENAAGATEPTVQRRGTEFV